MNTQCGTTFQTSPPLLLILKESVHAIFANIRQIIHHAHPVLRAVSFIELFDPGARKILAVITQGNDLAGIDRQSLALFADHHLAGPAILGLGPIMAIATLAFVLLTLEAYA